MNDKTLTAVELTRELLTSIGMKDIHEIEAEKLTDTEFYERAGTVAGVYRQYIKNVLRLFIQRQLEELGMKSESLEQMMFARGTINGLVLLDEWFKEQDSVIKQKVKDTQEDNTPEEHGEVL